MASAYQVLYSPMAHARTRPFTNNTGAAIAGGAMVLEGNTYGVLLDPLEDGESGVMVTDAADIAVPKTAGEAYTAEQNLYFDVATELFTSSDAAGANPFRGRANVAAAGTDATVRIRLVNDAE